MEKILLLTVAGLSSRFSSSVGYSCIKCLYSSSGFENSLIAEMLKRHMFFDKIVIVGGFRYDELRSTICRHYPELSDKIIFAENSKYDVYGSGYSLYKGLTAINDMEYDELVFAEGDLFVDDDTFEEICHSPESVMTYNTEPVFSDKSVVLYFDANDCPHYIYDTDHGLLKIDEPFLSLFNSGQIWKLADISLVKKLLSEMPEKMFIGTNLVFINSYFRHLTKRRKLIGFKKWFNCNTVTDYNSAMEEK